MKTLTPSIGFPADIIEYNINRLTEAQIQDWYKTLPFEQGVAVNSICWTNYNSHNDLVNAVKGIDFSVGDKVATIIAWYQHQRRCLNGANSSIGGVK